MDYYVKRVLHAVLTLVIVVTLAFVLIRLMPGGPLQTMEARLYSEAAEQGGTVDMERIHRQVEVYTNINPDEPIHVQYYEYMRDVIVYQDFGKSIFRNEPVFDVLFKAMPWSVFISVYGLFLGFTANIVLGAVMAYKEGSRFDTVSTIGSIFLSSTPYYVGAIVMLAILSFQYGLFPTGGRMDDATTPGLNVPFIAGIIYHGALPILSSFIVGFGTGALAMRGNSIRVLGEDYLRVARLRGISPTRIATRYVARNAVLPMYTGLMIGIASIFGSSIILERIFTYPGVGWYTFNALEGRDYPLIMGSFIFFTTITIIGVMIADLTYGYIDPRVQGGDEREAF